MQIGDEIIENLSGPVNFTLLKPKNINYPIIILFGDVHDGSNEGQCTCKNRCYKIYSVDFLKILDSLSKDNHPVDLYFESFFTRKDFNRINKGNYDDVFKTDIRTNIMSQFVSNTKVCFYKELKKSLSKYKCPAENIRWHHSDPRQIKYTGDYKYYYEGQIFGLYLIFSDYGENKNIKKFTYSIKHNLFLDDEKFKNNLIMLYKCIFNDKKYNTNTFFKQYFNLNNEYFVKHSLILKQIRKSIFTFDIWEKWFSEYYIYVLNKNYIKNISANINEILDSLDNKVKLEKLLNNQSNTFDIENILLYVTSIFLDMYYITRSFKMIDNPAYLSFGYFGLHHTDNLTYLLTNIMKMYTLKYETPEHNLSRCLKLPKFNLNKELSVIENIKNEVVIPRHIEKFSLIELIKSEMKPINIQALFNK